MRTTTHNCTKICSSHLRQILCYESYFGQNDDVLHENQSLNVSTLRINIDPIETDAENSESISLVKYKAENAPQFDFQNEIETKKLYPFQIEDVATKNIPLNDDNGTILKKMQVKSSLKSWDIMCRKRRYSGAQVHQNAKAKRWSNFNRTCINRCHLMPNTSPLVATIKKLNVDQNSKRINHSSFQKSPSINNSSRNLSKLQFEMEMINKTVQQRMYHSQENGDSFFPNTIESAVNQNGSCTQNVNTNTIPSYILTNNSNQQDTDFDVIEDRILNENSERSSHKYLDPYKYFENDGEKKALKELNDLEHTVVLLNSETRPFGANEPIFDSYSLLNPLNVINPKWDRQNTNKIYRKALYRFFIGELRKAFTFLDSRRPPKFQNSTSNHVSEAKQKKTNIHFAIMNPNENLKHDGKNTKEKILKSIVTILDAANTLNVFTPTLIIPFIKLSLKRKQSRFASEYLARYRSNTISNNFNNKFMLKYLMRVHIRANNHSEVLKELTIYFNNTQRRDNFMSTTWTDLFQYARQFPRKDIIELLVSHFSEYKLQFQNNIQCIAEASSFFKHIDQLYLYEEVMKMDAEIATIQNIFNLQSSLRILEYLSVKDPQLALEMFQDHCMKDKNASRQLYIYGLTACVNTQNWRAGVDIFTFFFPDETLLRFDLPRAKATFSKELPPIDIRCLPSLAAIFSNIHDLYWYLLQEVILDAFLPICKTSLLEELYSTTLQYPSPLAIQAFNNLFKSQTPPAEILKEYIELLFTLSQSFFKNIMTEECSTFGDLCIHPFKDNDSPKVDQFTFSKLLHLENLIHHEILTKLENCMKMTDVTEELVTIAVLWHNSLANRLLDLKAIYQKDLDFMNSDPSYIPETEFAISGQESIQENEYEKIEAAIFGQTQNNNNSKQLEEAPETKYNHDKLHILHWRNQHLIANKKELQQIEAWNSKSKSLASKYVNRFSDVRGWKQLPSNIDTLVKKHNLRS